MFNSSIYLEQIELAILIAFCVFFAIQLYYYLRLYLPVTFYKPPQHQTRTEPLSVIICARNEAYNLQQNLPAVLEQDYPDFEVIVVNDCSTDETDEVLGDFLKKYKNLRTTSIPVDKKFSHGKKLAVMLGIKAAKNENLVFTDADCKPAGKDWLKLMQNGLMEKDIVLGYGGFYYKKGFLNNYQRFDTLFIAIHYFGFALARNPYMGVGRNLAYKKELFFKNKGFANHYGLLSGDDDLFINEVATPQNVSLMTAQGSFTRSAASLKWSIFFNQKVRHLSTANKYKAKHIFMLGLEPVSRMWYYALLVLVIALTEYWQVAAGLALLRLVLQEFLFIRAGKQFKEKNLWLTCIIFDSMSLFINLAAYIIHTIRGRKTRWK